MDNKISSDVASASNDGEQMVRVLPTDSNTVQMPSTQSMRVKRAYEGITFISHSYWDGSKEETTKGGELATLLKKPLTGLKGATLEGFRIFVNSEKANSSIAICFTSASEPLTTFKDVYRSINSKVLGFNAASVHQRMELETTMPTGLGMQLVPCDPAHPATHMYVSTSGKFKGTLSVYFKVAVDTVVLQMDDDLFL